MIATKDGVSSSGISSLRFRRRGTWLAMVAILVTVGLTGCMLQLGNLFSASWLYTQTAKQGTVTATDAESRYIIQLTEASPTTVGFTDRPAHSASSISTASFISQWSSLFAGGSPNASMVFDDSDDIYVFTLSGPVFHPVDHTLWYHAKLIPDGSATTPPETFQSASVFIDNAGPGLSGNTRSSSVYLNALGWFPHAQIVQLQYSALPRSMPAVDGSRLWLFGPGDVYTAPPLQEMPVESDSPMGMQTLSGLGGGEASYSVAYSTGSDQHTICAVIPLGSFGPGVLSTTTVAIETVGENVVLVRYSTPSGSAPNANGHWVGLWRGEFDPNMAPLARISVASDATLGSLAFEDILIERAATYTVVYCMGKEASTAAATATFEI